MKVRHSHLLELRAKVALIALKGASRDFVLRTFGCTSTQEILTITTPLLYQPHNIALSLQATTPAVPLPATD